MTITIEQAQLTLSELIEKSALGEKIVITRDHLPVAELVPVVNSAPKPVFGSCKGMLTIVSEDDDHLADFNEYMK